MLELDSCKAPYFNYIQDAFERSILFLDILRQRGNDYLEQSSRTAPHVLSFGFNLLIDGRTPPKPVNYALVEIVPPTDVTIGFRSARRSWTRHWRDEAGQRGWRCHGGRPCLLLCRLPAETDAGTDD